MQCEGEIKGISLDWKSRQTEVVLLTNAKPVDLEALGDKKLSVNFKVFRQQRSLEANAYYWVLCSKISEAIGQSVAWVHNKALRKCQYLELVGGKAVYVIIPDTEEAEQTALEAETFHLARTTETKPGKDGKTYRTYVLLRGSHSFDSKEMSHLIDVVVDEAKELGIETITENEKQEMMERYGKKFAENTKE